MKSTQKKINLDWNKLTGFNQVSGSQSNTTDRKAKAAIRAKVGGKIGIKPPPGGGA